MSGAFSFVLRKLQPVCCQSDRISGWGRLEAPLEVTSPSPCSIRASQSRLPRMCPGAFEPLQGWRLPQLPGHLRQCSATLPVQQRLLSSEGPSFGSLCARGPRGCPWPRPLCSLPLAFHAQG